MDRNDAAIRGMVCTIRFYGEGRRQQVYISFGEWDEATDTDTFGVPDRNIFYYLNGPEDLHECLSAAAEGRKPTLDWDEWEVVEWDGEFVYDDREAGN